ncbi:MAG: tRNA dihydrouridine synthase DusB [Bacillota bacterium]
MFAIGSLNIKNQVISAPMAGISTRTFRDILRFYGAGLSWGEMISAQALVYQNQKTFDLLGLDDEAAIRAVQLSGSRPEVLAEAARLVVERGAQIIDLNLGCPAPKIVRNGEGCKLMKDPVLIGRLISAVREAVTVPVTAKMRLGWMDGQINFLEVARILEAHGADAITLHARTREQFYSGQADWNCLSRLSGTVKIPVIGNGDVFTAQAAQEMLKQTGCAAIMVGRGMVGNPWLIRDCVAVLEGGCPPPEPGYAEKINQALQHLQLQVAHDIKLWQQKTESPSQAQQEGEAAAVRSMRGHLGWYLKGLPQAAAVRSRLNQLTSVEQIKELFAVWLCQIGVNL